MFQKTQIIGRLGRNPFVHTTKNGNTFTTFPIAADGPGDKTTWFKVKTWGKLAEVCGKYLSKGRLVYVEGTVSVEIWTDKEGNARAELVLTANTVKFLDSGNGHKAEAAEDGGDEDETAADESTPEPEPAPEPAESAPAAQPVAEDDFYDFDDLPF